MCVLMWYCSDATVVLIQFRKYVCNRTCRQWSCIGSGHFFGVYRCQPAIQEVISATNETLHMHTQQWQRSCRLPLVFVAKDAILMLHACTPCILIPRQRPPSLVWERNKCMSEIVSWPPGIMHRFLPIVVGKVYEHHTGKALHSAAYLYKKAYSKL